MEKDAITRNDIYCLIYFPDQQKGFGLNREYSFITDEKSTWGEIAIGDVIEHDEQFFPTFKSQFPRWAGELKDKGHRHIALWTNYYEGR